MSPTNITGTGISTSASSTDNANASSGRRRRERVSPLRVRLLLAFLMSLLVAPAWAAPDSVNVNTASAETIAAVLQGVGMSRAEAIVAYREANGEFADAYDLANVKGIGDRTVELNEDRIRLRD